MTSYLELDVVLAAHSRLIGPDLVREPGQVEATVFRPPSGFGDVEFYPTLALTLDNDEVYELTMSASQGQLSLEEIAALLEAGMRPMPLD